MVTAEHIRHASERIRPITHRTPVLTSYLVNQRAGSEVFFKCENFQRGGAFKIRGAANFLFSIPKTEIARGVVAFSSGNHAQAVAIAARHLKVQATIVMPSDAPQAKLDATSDYGAIIVTYNRLSEDREALGRRISSDLGATLVPPFDHEWIIAGQGTTALELMEDQPDLDAIVTPIGGGGLISGCAIAARHANPKVRVFGVEPEDGNDFYLSLKAGERIEIPTPQTIADGLRAPKPGALTFPIVQKLVDEVILVSDQELRETIGFLASRMKIVVEPSGAAAAAAVLFRKLPGGLSKIGVVISGGNM